MASTDDDHSQDLAQRVIDGFVCNANYNADLVGRFLQATRDRDSRATPRKPQTLAADELLELGGVLRLGVWERQGWLRHLPGLPTVATAVAELERRHARHGNGKPTSRHRLLHRVLETWFARFAWSGPEELGVDVLLEQPADPDLLGNVADFLWAHRSEHAKADRPS